MVRICICDNCGKTFVSDRPDGEALKECAERFGEMPREDLALVCTGCFDKIIAAIIMLPEAPDEGRI